MSEPAAVTHRNGNRILAGLPAETQRRLHPMLTSVHTQRRDSIWEPNKPIEFVYFPINAVISVLAVDNGGQAVEVGTIGNEGVAGLPIFLGADVSPALSFTQVGGDAHRMRAEDFRRESRREGPLRDILDRYTQGFMTQIAQSTACNRLHTSRERLARWILMVQDRLGRDHFELTHDFMAQMLGVRRATVSETAQELQQDGVIQYQRGSLTVLDRRRLEEASCSCYSIVRDEFDRLLGSSPHSPSAPA